MDPIATLNQGVPSTAAQIQYYDPANGQGRKASMGALAEVVGTLLSTPGAIPGASLVLTADGLPSDDVGYDGWLAADPKTGALYLKVNGSWIVKDAGSAPAALSVSGTPVLSGTVGQNYAGFLVVASGGVAPYAYSDPAGSLPDGLSIHPQIGLVHGIPTQTGASGLIALTATDATGALAILAPFSIDIAAAGSNLALFGNPLTSATVGSSYGFTLSATGGTAPYTYSVVSGVLPAGITLNATTGAVSGIPTVAGTAAAITLGVTDADGTQASLAPFSITVAAAPVVLAISGTPVTAATVGAPYAFTPSASGGVTPYTFALVAGTLPAGLSFSTSTGAISGTPTAAGTASGLSIRVTDHAGSTATLPAFGITVTAAGATLSISGTPSTAAQVGNPYSFTPSASGGTTPYTFSISAGALPAGLSINAVSGAIAGTPTADGVNAGIVVRVTDGVGATANLAAFTLTVTSAALRASAPFDAQLTGMQSNSTNTARIACGNVSLGNTNGDDWSFYLQTEWRDTNVNKGGGLACIGNQANNLQTAAGNFALWVNGSGTTTGNPWSTDNAYAGTLSLSAQDDDNNTVTSRKVISTMTPGTLAPYPLIGKAGVVAQPGSVSHGVLVTCKAGVVSMWDVDPVNGAFLLDEGPGLTTARNDNIRGFWKTIQNKPLYLGFLNLVTQTPRSYWGGPIGQVVLWNGGAMTSAQAVMLAQGVDARDVLPFEALRGDRYWPGSQTVGGQMEELIAGQHGTVEGVGASFISTARVQTADAGVTLDWRDGVIFPADLAPASTSTVRAWGSRRGAVTEVQIRIVSSAAADPAPAPDVLVDWTTMTATTAGRWQGDIAGVPHAAGVKFKAETRYKLPDGNWSPARRAHGTFGCGVGAIAMGQSIVSKLMQMSGSSRAVSAGSVGKMTAFDVFMPIGTLNRIPANNTSGWQDRNAASYTIKWGQTVAADLLTQMTGQRSYFLDISIEGIAISRYDDTGTTWQRVLKAMHEARPRYVIWNQGHGDLTMNQATRWAAMDKLLGQLKAAAASAPGGAFTFKMLVIPVGSDWVDQLNSMRNHDLTWAQQRALDGEPVKLFTSITDQPNDGDMIHPAATSADMGCMSERIATGLAFEQGHSTYDANGGFLGAGTWSWSGGTLTVDLPITGGSGTIATRAGGAPTGFRLQLDGGGSVFPTTSALLTGPNRVRLTYAVGSAPTSVSYTYMSGYPGTVGNGTKPTLAESGILDCLFDTRSTPMVSGLPGMPVMSVPLSRTVVPA
jgi:hypothetical protein